jgi:hypothetical protein
MRDTLGFDAKALDYCGIKNGLVWVSSFVRAKRAVKQPVKCSQKSVIERP